MGEVDVLGDLFGAVSASEDGGSVRRLWARYTLEDLREVATSRGGECLSSEFLGSGALYLWRCGSGHEWRSKARNVVRGTWCGECVRRNHCLTLADLQEAAAERGGFCQSEVVSGYHAKYEWRCGFGHTWVAAFERLGKGGWCPICTKSSSLGERISRSVLSSMFNAEFLKCRPEWLVGKMGRKLELAH